MTALLILASTALADVPPSNTTGCSDKAAGDRCETDAGDRGSCAQQTCSRLDYSNGTPPTSVDYDCLVCVAGPAEDGGSGGCGGVFSAGVLLGAFGLSRLRRPIS